MKLNARLKERLEALDVSEEKFESLVASAMEKDSRLTIITARQVVLDSLTTSSESSDTSGSKTTSAPATGFNIKEDIGWVYNNLGGNPSQNEAPSPGAWFMLQEAIRNPAEFYKTYLPKILPSKKEEEEEGRMSDTGRNVIRTIEQLQRFRAKNNVDSSAAAKPSQSLATESSKDVAATA